MKVTEIDERNVTEALAEVETFMQRNPQFDGSELSANLLWEKMEREDRAFNVDELERTYHELASKGLLDGVDYGTDTLLEPVQDERDYKPEDEDDPNVEVVEYTWHDEEQPSREDFEALSTNQLRELIKQSEPVREMTLDEQIDALSTRDLGALITRVTKR